MTTLLDGMLTVVARVALGMLVFFGSIMLLVYAMLNRNR